MTISSSLSSSSFFKFSVCEVLLSRGEGIIGSCGDLYLFSSREFVEEKLEVSGWQTNVEVFVVAVWITTGCLFFPFLPHIHCMASYLRHEHILQISHSGTFLHPTPSLPKGLLDNE